MQKLILSLLFIIFFAMTSASTVNAGSVQIFDPLNVNVTPGESVVGAKKILEHLRIETSGGNDVIYISSENGSATGAYGGNLNGILNIHNACLPKKFGIADLGESFDSLYTTKKHQYEFDLIGNAEAKNFSLSVVDWGDFLPYGACPNDHCGMTMTAYNKDKNIVDTVEMFFTSSDTYVKKNTLEYGHTRIVSDACTASVGQPGNFTLTVNGSGIKRVTLKPTNPQSIDPHIAISDLSFELE
jgi:hypothetical protein